MEAIATAQSAINEANRPANLQLDAQGLYRDADRVWIPQDASTLLTRILIVAHNGSMGHRGHATTKNVVSSVFAINGLDGLVSDFLDACKLCPHVKGGKVVPRPWAPTLTTTIPNHILHWDFCKLGESNEGPEYLLVLKDSASHFVHLVPCNTPTADVAAKAIISWMAKEASQPFGSVTMVHTSRMQQLNSLRIQHMQIHILSLLIPHGKMDQWNA